MNGYFSHTETMRGVTEYYHMSVVLAVERKRNFLLRSTDCPENRFFLSFFFFSTSYIEKRDNT